MDLHRHGAFKFPNAGLVASSQGRGWSGIAAELRCHPPGELPAIVPTQMEITIATRRSPGAYVSRKGAGQRQRTAVEAGTVWFCPVGVAEDDIGISGALHDILHVYLPVERFAHMADLYGDPRIRADAVRYLADVDDDLVRQLGLAIGRELQAETSAGRMLVEAASLSLVARLAQMYGHDRPERAETEAGSTCQTRIRRVTEFIRDNLHRELTVAELAEVACLSPFHFARMFKAVTGSTPHGFVSAARLQEARRLLSRTATPLGEIALRSGFSGQSTFTSAFKRATGCTPGEYRRQQSPQ
ncbi:AraC family transcriptional regulator [Methylobacterium sp. 17Sr1-1]|uniref:helix-turn-helix domain-containing protein n=1 Tax=Methylobacterium sp. 17Sr1-1 TaxID=2202826 RepID=UPI000D6FDD99|nr:AraC family transcriptional regulator [Methylobacterium sp. 17Sr1-1]AWN51142.1 AraC family transcriptional regulator [Methylobacterium sp. 17Sr1-1]